MLDFKTFQVLTFDCYGTLIDWERGILTALCPLLARHHLVISEAEILECYAALETQAEAAPYRPYRTVLSQVVEGFGAHYHFTPTVEDMACLVDSLAAWPPFPDTVEALSTLRRHFKLAVISNIDDDLFAHSSRLLQVPFDWVITASQVQSYKPSRRNFTYAIEHIGLPKEHILHVAQSLYHDIAPATRLGLASVRVNRRHAQSGGGATPAATARPDLIVPDLRSLVAAMGLT